MHAFEKGLGTAPTAVWLALGCQLAIQNGQHGSQDGQLGGQDGQTCAPKLFRARPGATSQRRRSLKTAQDGSDVDFRGFLGRFLLDFLSLLARFSFYFSWTDSPGAVGSTHLQCVPRTALIAQTANNNCLPDNTDAPRVDAPRVYTACSHTIAP